MKILAIDTSSPICSVAILEDDKLIDKNELNDGRTHSENLMPLLDELLKRNNLEPKAIELIACCVGPGSFTGIRIGVASIKPIAEVLNIKVASVMSLETLARSVEGKNTIVSLIDARNNQVYCGIFDEQYNKKEEYLADDINEIIEVLKKYENICFVGNGAELHKELLTNSLKNVEFSKENNQSAENVGKIGYKKYLENDLCTADTIMPVYLRKSQAERLKK
ncbi:MAG: tRNA (adenosine(37)-N6)-threonylcarbamoyltransferase complex dimerization subunit type 1 TsaB [Clostridia bacterium]|nr:tRNA (adenosine(37)-N6)-threonylcarbamoyltransferase complex dimerization subunit type 1 TsaB [Clostridia bacterium]